MKSLVDHHFPTLDGARRSTAARLIEVILAELPDAEHERKWGRLTFTHKDDWHHWICAVAARKDSVALVVHKGALLADPHRAMEGAGRYLRSISFRSPDDVDPEVVAPILREAAARQTEMLDGEAG